MAAKLGAPTGEPKKRGRPKKSDVPAAAPGTNSVAGPGHNSEAIQEEQRRLLYRETERINEADKQLAALAEQAKPHKTAKAQARAAIQKAGIPLEAYDDRMRALKRTRAENVAYEVARDLVSSAYALPTSAEVRNLFDGNAAAQEGMDWEADGFTARMAGAEPKAPVTGTDGQLWLKGWHDANKLASDAKGQPSTAQAAVDAIKADGEPDQQPVAEEPAADALPVGKFDWGTVGERGEVIVLNRSAFALEDDDGLDQASRLSVIHDVEPYWDAAARVLAFWDGKRRVLKEPDYEDTGGDDTGSPEHTLVEADEESVLADALAEAGEGEEAEAAEEHANDDPAFD